MKQTKKKGKFKQDRIRCKVLPWDGYINRLFIITSSKGTYSCHTSTLKASIISHFFASLVFQNNPATLAGKTNTENADHSSIYRAILSTWAFLSLAFSQCWLTFFRISIVFNIWILISTLGNHRALMKNIFRSHLTTVFSNTFCEYSKSILSFNFLIYSRVQNRFEIKSLFRKRQTKATLNALGFWAVWNNALQWLRVVTNLTLSWIR